MRVRFSLRLVLTFVAVVSILLALGFLLKDQSIQESKRRACVSNAKAILLAMHGYKEKYGKHPPQALLGPNGEPLHSWRILLLEFIDPVIFQKYSFDEPWDGPNNSQLTHSMPSCYRCPLDRRTNSHFTSYVGEADSSSGLNVVEARYDIHWMSPLDNLRQKNPLNDCVPPTRIDYYSVTKD